MFTVRADGLDEAIKHLNGAVDKAHLSEVAHNIIERISKVGVSKATELYAEFADNGEEPAVEGPVWIDETRAQITATGEYVGFVEFGTGVYQPAYPDSAVAAAYGAIRGEYGLKRGRRRSWIYYGVPGKYGEQAMARGKDGDYYNLSGRVRTYGEPPAAAMYNAAKEMRRELEDIGRGKRG